MGAHQRAERRGTEHVLLVRLPAQQTGRRLKGQVLGQQAAPLLEPTRDDHPRMGRQRRVARQRVALRLGIDTDLPRQVQQAKAAGHGDRRVPIFLDMSGGHLRAMLGH